MSIVSAPPHAGFVESRLHERSPQTLPSPGWSDVQLCQVTLRADAPDSGAETEHGQPIWSAITQQDQRVATFDELPQPFSQCRRRRRGLIKFSVEVVQQLPDRAGIVTARKTNKVHHGSSQSLSQSV